jgi:hypothetical protein
MSRFLIQGIAILLFGVFVLPRISGAADISHVPMGDKASGLIIITGRLNDGDEKRFNLVMQRYSKGAVLLMSPGGNLLTGLEIGRIIRMRNFATGVAPETRCASACALAWLGGTQRFMSSNSLIGFHAVSIVDKGAITETGLGNAVVGAYLTTLGLPLSAVVYISKASPDQITWLNLEDAKRVGIEVTLLDLAEAGLSATQNIPDEERIERSKETHNTTIISPNRMPPLKASERWLVVASRADLKESISIAQQYKLRFSETRVVKSENGQYGITIGRFDMTKGPEVMKHLIEEKRIPQDSYLTAGKRFLSIAWQ